MPSFFNDANPFIDPRVIYEYGFGDIGSRLKKSETNPNSEFRGILLDEKGKPKKGSEFNGTLTRTLYVSGLVYAYNPNTRDVAFILVQMEDNNIILPTDQLRYNETCRQALSRILFTDIGLKVREQNIREKVLDDNPKKNEAQDIVFRYMVELQYKDLMKQVQYSEINGNTSSRGGTKKIKEIVFVEYSEIDNVKGISKPLRQMIEQFIERRYKV